MDSLPRCFWNMKKYQHPILGDVHDKILTCKSVSNVPPHLLGVRAIHQSIVNSVATLGSNGDNYRMQLREHLHL